MSTGVFWSQDRIVDVIFFVTSVVTVFVLPRDHFILSGIVLLIIWLVPIFLYVTSEKRAFLPFFIALLFSFLIPATVFHTPFPEILSIIIVISLPLFLLINFVNYTALPGIYQILTMVFGVAASLVFNFLKRMELFPTLSVYDFYFFSGIACFFVVFSLLSMKIMSVPLLLKSISVSGAPTILYLLILSIQASGLHGLFLDRFGSKTNINPNLIAIFLDILFPVTLFLGFRSNKSIPKIFYHSTASIYGACIFLTASRGSLPGIFILMFYLIIKKRSVKKTITVILIAAASIILFGSKSSARLFQPSRFDLLSDVGRVKMYVTGNKILEENYYLFGIGMNKFHIAKFKYGFPVWFDNEKSMSSHNFFLELWLGWGVFGVLGWISLSSELIFKLINIKLPENLSSIKPPLIFAIVDVSLHGLFDSALALPAYLILLFSLLACMAYLISIGKSLLPPDVHSV